MFVASMKLTVVPNVCRRFFCLSVYRRDKFQTLLQKCYRTRELPLQVGVGLTLHRQTRSAKLVNFCSQIGISINYDRVKRIENNIAETVIAHMENTDGIYIPPDLEPNMFTHFATDNLDFNEDTPDGKRNLHATVLVAYQSLDSSFDTVKDLTMNDNCESVHIPENIYKLILCTIKSNTKPSLRPLTRSGTEFIQHDLLKTALIADISWLFGKRMELFDEKKSGLTWSAHNSLVVENTNRRKTTVAVFPILNMSPTDRSVQLTVIKQFQKVRELLHGKGKKTVITVDLGLYRPMQQLQMSRNDMETVLMPGDLHIIMAQLRAIGTFIELSGIPELWIECDMFGERVVKGILDGKRVSRSLDAHVTTLYVFFSSLTEAFFTEHPDIKIQVDVLSEALLSAWDERDAASVQRANSEFESKLRELSIVSKLTAYCHKMIQQRPTFAAAYQYINMVFSMLSFVRAVRSGDWNLRLSAIQDFIKYFFAMDLRNYSAMSTLHLEDMEALSVEDPETWSSLQCGHWAPNKKGLNFCCLGADEALEQENRKLKVLGGLVGISLQPETLTKYFLVAPYSAKISQQVNESMKVKKETREHHQMGQAVNARQLRWMKALTDALKNFNSPFQYEGDDLINLVTRRVAPDVVRDDVCRMTAVGTEQYNSFVQNRIVDRSVNLWDRMPNVNLKLFRTVAKKNIVKTKAGVVEVKQDQNLFTRTLTICRSRPDMVLKDIIGKYELTVVPRSMFHPDGSMMHISAKSKLMHHLEELVKDDVTKGDTDSQTDLESNGRWSIAIVDAMAEVQMFTPVNSSTIAELSCCFADKILNKYSLFSEVHLVFDTYFDDSLKGYERKRREKGVVPIRYKIDANTVIRKVPMNKLLSHNQTKGDLTEYFGKAFLEAAALRNRNVTVSFKNQAISTGIDTSELASTHEEGDTKIMLHAVHAARRGAESIRIFSPDTDVLVLSVRRAPLLPDDTLFVTLGQHRREINLKKIYDKLGSIRANALPGLHAISGADVTGSFCGKAKTSFWNKFLVAPDNVLHALTALGKTENIDAETFDGIEQFVCSVYATAKQATTLRTLADLRWYLYSTKQTHGETLPPTISSLRPAIRRSHFQCIEWEKDIEAHPYLPSAADFGWSIENGNFEPILCEMPCAPDEVLHLIRCSCVKSRCVPLCKCASQNPRLTCTEMCACGADSENCDNTGHVEDTDNSDIDSDEDSDMNDDIF